MKTKLKDLVLPPNNVAATGSSASDAAAMPSNVVYVTAADGTKGIKLPEPTPGRVCAIYNTHATNRLKIYPHTGGDINDGTTNAALLLDGKTYSLFHAMDGTTWAALEVNRITSPTLVTPLIDDGDAGVTVTSANQTHATPVTTIPDIGDAADSFVMNDTAATLTNKTLTSPTITGPTQTINVEAVAAAGNAQGNGTAVTAAAPALIHGTGADATKGIVLPAAAAGKVYYVKNADAANAILKVYPASGDAINALSADAAISMAAKTAALFVAIDATTWFTFSLLPS